MKADWTPLRAELAHWRAQQLELPIWWRDDDAITRTRALKKLLKMGAELGLPLHLAVIPKRADKYLVQTCGAFPGTVAMVHGWSHRDHSPAGQKKSEFGQERPTAMEELKTGLTRLTDLFGSGLLRLFVPPWNNISPHYLASLQGQGFFAVSTYGPRAARLDQGLVRINTHLDPINWTGKRSLVDPEVLIARTVKLLRDRRQGVTDRAEPLGYLSHHLVHNRAIWSFTRTWISEMLDGGAVPCNLLELRDNLP